MYIVQPFTDLEDCLMRLIFCRQTSKSLLYCMRWWFLKGNNSTPDKFLRTTHKGTYAILKSPSKVLLWLAGGYGTEKDIFRISTGVIPHVTVFLFKFNMLRWYDGKHKTKEICFIHEKIPWEVTENRDKRTQNGIEDCLMRLIFLRPTNKSLLYYMRWWFSIG